MKPTYTTIENLHWILTKPIAFTKEWKPIHIYTKLPNVIPLHHIFESFQFMKANYNSHQPTYHNLVVLPKSIEKLFPYSPSCFSKFSQNAPTHLPKVPFCQYCLTNMIDGKENEEATTKDKCKSLGLCPNHQWLQQKRKRKMTSTTPKTHIMKDKKDENIDEFPMLFTIRIFRWMIDKNIYPSQGFSNSRFIFSIYYLELSFIWSIQT